MKQIDEKTVVPIGWVVGGFTALLSFCVLSVFWIASVNYRLQRIEEKLGIPVYQAGSVLPDAVAGGK
jgi:hypothetical protein